MNGVVHIERENTDGDRGIVNTIDIEGLPSGTDVMEVVREACQKALVEPRAFIIRAMHNDGWNYKLIHRENLPTVAKR